MPQRASHAEHADFRPRKRLRSEQKSHRVKCAFGGARYHASISVAIARQDVSKAVGARPDGHRPFERRTQRHRQRSMTGRSSCRRAAPIRLRADATLRPPTALPLPNRYRRSAPRCLRIRSHRAQNSVLATPKVRGRHLGSRGRAPELISNELPEELLEPAKRDRRPVMREPGEEWRSKLSKARKRDVDAPASSVRFGAHVDNASCRVLAAVDEQEGGEIRRIESVAVAPAPNVGRGQCHGVRGLLAEEGTNVENDIANDDLAAPRPIEHAL